MSDMKKESKKVLLFLAQGFEDMEAVTILDIMGWTEYKDHIPRVKVVTCGFHPEVRGRFGIVISPDILIEDIDLREYDALVLPGGFHSHGYDEAYDPRIHKLVRTIHRNGGIIATMCVGILPVAEAGLLKGKRATSYPYSRKHDNLGKLRKYGALISEENVVVDDRIISCAGPGSSLEVAFLLLDMLIGREYMEEVSCLMICKRPPMP